MLLRTGILEDDKGAAQRLSMALERYGKEKGVRFSLTFFPDAETLLESSPVGFDLLFLDIHLPGMDGLQAAKEVRRQDPNVFLIFVTDLAQYALKGYEVDAFDYIVKPVVYEHLASKMDKIVRLKQEDDGEAKFTFKVPDGLLALKASQIYYVEVQNHRLLYHTDQGDYEAYGTLKDVENRLPKGTFARCNHCYLVNLKYVTGIDHNEVLVQKDRLLISRPKKKPFLDAFTRYLGSHS